MKTSTLNEIVALSLKEDIGAGDVSTNTLIPKDHVSSASLIFKSDGILCGLNFAKAAFKKLDPSIQFKAFYNDGDRLKPKTVIATIKGRTRALLTAERVAINFLTYLSSIATNTNHYVKAILPHRVAIMDTRKTTPMLRVLDRYAVRVGGGVNHRFDLSSMVMIKDNHYVLDKNPITLVDLVRKRTTKKIVLEVDTLDQLRLALTSKADIILLDNMTPEQTTAAVKMRNATNPKILLESSGGINLLTVKKYAACGVERISVGSLTQQRLAIDISLDFSL